VQGMRGKSNPTAELIITKTSTFIKYAEMQKRFMNALAFPNRNCAVSQSVM